MIFLYMLWIVTILRDDLQAELGETLIVIDTIIPTIKFKMERNSSGRIKEYLDMINRKKNKKGLL